MGSLMRLIIFLIFLLTVSLVMAAEKDPQKSVTVAEKQNTGQEVPKGRARIIGYKNGDDWTLPRWVRMTSYAGRYWMHSLEEVKQRSEENKRAPGLHFCKTIHVYWNKVEPREGRFDWKKIDEVVDEIKKMPKGAGFGFWPWFCRRDNRIETIPVWALKKYHLPLFKNGGIDVTDHRCEFLKAVKPMIMALGKRYRTNKRFVCAEMRAPFGAPYGEWCLDYKAINNPKTFTQKKFINWAKAYFDLWARAFKGQERKLVMVNSTHGLDEYGISGELGGMAGGYALVKYGYLKGFGERDGSPSGTHIFRIFGYKEVTPDGYVIFNHRHPPVINGSFYGSENTEFDIKSNRWGPRSYTAFRFKKALLWNLSVRRNWLAIESPATAKAFPELVRWVELELGKKPKEAPDCWSFLSQLQRKWYSTVKNSNSNNKVPIKNYIERWLHQRDVGLRGSTVAVEPEPPMYGQKDGLLLAARRTDIKKGSRYMYFMVDKRFAPKKPETILLHVTYKDGRNILWHIDYTSKKGKVKTPIVMTSGSNEWKTVEFKIPYMRFSHSFKKSMDFRIAVSGANDLTVNFVRVIKVKKPF